MKLDRVVIATDFSASSFAAAQWAARHLATGAELVLVHVVSVPEPPSFLRGRFPPRNVLIDTARAGADVRLRALSHSLGAERNWLEVRVGDAAGQIAEVARRYDADLIVTGRHHERHGVLGRIGTTAEALVRSGAAPVLLGTGVRDVSPRRILVALDESDTAGAVVGWAQYLSARCQAHVTALHVVPSAVLGYVLASAPAGREEREAEADTRDDIRRDTDRWIESLAGRGLPRDRVASEVAFGEPGQEILAAAARLEAELIIVGTRNRDGARRWLLGSVAGEVLRGAATCPVLVVPPTLDQVED